ncbi:NAD(P)-dependent methylenetetrahydromethanopterin dehydrogenase [Novipirellula artificiosorum]|uniref:Bifunctional protein MdtA n=1 Tax=Novipirellula artificiosorum TaxID=2528016 RepID=A0A5C6DR65_9BACT|nr:NAD(P)-dependent methylenetetrahydromethanopterin dehydrogenase [Novipirellula artificiosorum]TWU39258.1 Bifunctional protein MdtA [Novipirellula artificiosorum]
MPLPKLLIQLDVDEHPSSFDGVVAYDSGVDHLLRYASVTADNVTSLVHGAMFTRGSDQLRNTAIFVGGSNVTAAEQLMKKVHECFFGPVRVSTMLDANGCNTTAAAAVVCAAREVKLDAATAVVLGATGPVGQRVTRMLAREGAKVRATSRSIQRASEVCDSINASCLGCGSVEPDQVNGIDDARRVLREATIVVACGAAGTQLIDKQTLANCDQLKVAIDLNAVPPAGIEGVEVTHQSARVGEVVTYGAIGVGGLKMKTHRAAIKALFESNEKVLDDQQIYEIAKQLG